MIKLFVNHTINHFIHVGQLRQLAAQVPTPINQFHFPIPRKFQMLLGHITVESIHVSITLRTSKPQFSAFLHLIEPSSDSHDFAPA